MSFTTVSVPSKKERNEPYPIQTYPAVQRVLPVLL